MDRRIKDEEPCNKQESPMQSYMDYLRRYTRTSGKSIAEANQELLCREIAKDYGVTEQELENIDLRKE